MHMYKPVAQAGHQRSADGRELVHGPTTPRRQKLRGRGRRAPEPRKWRVACGPVVARAAHAVGARARADLARVGVRVRPAGRARSDPHLGPGCGGGEHVVNGRGLFQDLLARLWIRSEATELVGAAVLDGPLLAGERSVCSAFV